MTHAVKAALKRYEEFKKEYETKLEKTKDEYKKHQLTLDYSPVLNMMAVQVTEQLIADKYMIDTDWHS